MTQIVLIDDDRTIQAIVKRALEGSNGELIYSETAADGLEKLKTMASGETDKVKKSADVVLLDIVLPDTSGLEAFKEIKELDRRLPVIFITADATSQSVIEAMQLGAFDYLTKPLHLSQLRDLIQKAIEYRRMMHVPVALAIDETVEPGESEAFLGRSPQILEVFKTIGKVARQKVSVLIRGESGTGKELVARAIYQNSDRSQFCFMAVNCAAIPDQLLESELFGHEKGAFTGADRRRIGKFEQCNEGTILLDEVGDMPPLLQGKVLRLLQDQAFERVGGNETIRTDVRVIAATNRNLEQMIEQGQFRADLLYRLDGVSIFLPPLREREDDLEPLLRYFISLFVREMNRPEVEGISPEALAILKKYSWPGNIRELQSVVRQMILNASGTAILPDDLPKTIREGPSATVTTAAGEQDLDLKSFVDRRLGHGSKDLYAEVLEFMERFLFTRVLSETGGNQSRASEILGITRGKIRDRITQYNITMEKNIGIDSPPDET